MDTTTPRREPSFRLIEPRYAQRLVRERRLKVAPLAARCGVSRQFLWMLLTGRRGCTEHVAVSLCLALRVPARRLFVDQAGVPATFRVPLRQRRKSA